MANIREIMRQKQGITFKFTSYLGRDSENKQIRKTKTWYPPPNVNLPRARKLAKIAAAEWELSLREERERVAVVEAKKEAPIEAAKPIEQGGEELKVTQTDFSYFAREVWFQIRVLGSDKAPKTKSYYDYQLSKIEEYFRGKTLQEITVIDIEKYLAYLRTEYPNQYKKGTKGVNWKTIHHHYVTLNQIFNYAEDMELIVKNPMNRVKGPKRVKKPVDAMSAEEAKRFIALLKQAEPEFECMMMVMLTTGVRRGELCGLQWRDVNFENGTISVARNVSYTTSTSVVVGAPKTENGYRTIPLVRATLNLLKERFKKYSDEYHETDITNAFIFHGKEGPFDVRTPDSVSRVLARFMKRNDFTNYSPHDLRHTCASLLIDNGADIKSVQHILGHADASTTLEFYVKTSLEQMRKATMRFGAAFDLN